VLRFLVSRRFCRLTRGSFGNSRRHSVAKMALIMADQMQSFWPALPKGDALFLFMLCMAVGSYVVFMFCLDQFDKPSIKKDENDPWNFVAPPYLTPRRQYLVGFFVYSGTLLLIFMAVSIIGPERILQIVKGAGADSTEIDSALKDFTTFPVVVAFIIVGLHPSLHLPGYLDFESGIRRLAHRIAYIPKNMDRIFNYMRFSDFDLPEQKVEESWMSLGLRRAFADDQTLNNITPLLDRAVVLSVLASQLAGDGEVDGAQELVHNLSLDVFRQYREKIEDTEVSIQSVYARISDSSNVGVAERRKAIAPAQKELVKTLEFLYVIFACAITGKGMDRISERLRVLGFTSSFPPDAGIPWDPILKTLGAAAVVLSVAWFIAAHTILGLDPQILVPTDTGSILETLLGILIVHFVAIAEALRIRTKFIALDKYYSETGIGSIMAYITIFAKCAVLCFGSYLVLNISTPISAVIHRQQFLEPSEVISLYLTNFLAWSIVPAICGVMVAYTIDRGSERPQDRVMSGLMECVALSTAALLATELVTGGMAPASLRIFNLVLYGGLGLVLGVMLPAAVRLHWAAQSNRLPDRISVLRSSVLEYFHNIQQFTEWLYMRNSGLQGRRPLDVLLEEAGLQQLTTFVMQTRSKVVPVTV
jgi:Protein of unknown function (DUF2384)